MSKQVTGIVYVHANGRLLNSKEGAKLNLGGKERTPVVANGRVIGYSEKVVPAMVECTLPHTADEDIIALNALVDATVTFGTDTGVTFLVANAFTTKPCELTGGEGDVSLELAGDPAIQQ